MQALDDDGLPHTLEHLIFLGSEDYPYKEVLDLLANRALADRTNAWTDTDHTCYTVYTAGPSGFLSILPVYLDHILYPNLREEDYLTEVHHINGEGQDAGVVYSEMQVLKRHKLGLRILHQISVRAGRPTLFARPDSLGLAMTKQYFNTKLQFCLGLIYHLQ